MVSAPAPLGQGRKAPKPKAKSFFSWR